MTKVTLLLRFHTAECYGACKRVFMQSIESMKFIDQLHLLSSYGSRWELRAACLGV